MRRQSQGDSGRARRVQSRQARSRSPLPPAIEALCREYAAVARSIWERERKQLQDNDQGDEDE